MGLSHAWRKGDITYQGPLSRTQDPGWCSTLLLCLRTMCSGGAPESAEHEEGAELGLSLCDGNSP